MISRGKKYSPDRTALGIARADGIRPVRKSDGPVHTEIDNHLCFFDKSMHVAWHVVLRICDKQDSGETQ